MGNHKRRRKRRHDPRGRPMPPSQARWFLDGNEIAISPVARESFEGIDRGVAVPTYLPDEPAIYFTIAPVPWFGEMFAREMGGAIAESMERLGRAEFRGTPDTAVVSPAVMSALVDYNATTGIATFDRQFTLDLNEESGEPLERIAADLFGIMRE